MAITFVASAKGEQVSGTTLSINKPTGVTDGDLMIAYMITQVASDSENWTGDTGWTEVADEGIRPNARIAYKVASSEGSSYTFSVTSSSQLAGGILAYRDAAYDTVGAFHQIGGTVSGDLVAPAITVAQNSSILLALYGCRGASNTFTTPTGMTSRESDSNATSPSWKICDESVSSGSSGTRTSTCSATTARSGVLLSIKPNAVTGTGSVTGGSDTPAASGSVTRTGTASVTGAGDTPAASGSVTRTGTAAITESADTPAASGKVTRTGTASITEAGDTANASGHVTRTGTSAVTETGDTPAASGATGRTGTGAVTEAGDTANGTAIVPLQGTGAVTESGDTPAGTGRQLWNIARPDADTSAGGWLPSTGTDLFAMVDETEADDADYIYATAATTCEMSFRPTLDPQTSANHVMSYRVWSPNGDGLTVTLKQGATIIASWLHAELPTTPTTYEQTLSAAECDAISDYTALSVTLESI